MVTIPPLPLSLWEKAPAKRFADWTHFPPGGGGAGDAWGEGLLAGSQVIDGLHPAWGMDPGLNIKRGHFTVFEWSNLLTANVSFVVRRMFGDHFSSGDQLRQ